MKKTFSIVIALALALALSLGLGIGAPVAADPGTTYYVSTIGSDVGDGSWHDPWKTIQHAVGQVASGDTIEVAPGTYSEGIIQISKNLTITGATTPSKPIIKPTTDTGTANAIGLTGRGWFQIHGGATVDFENLIFDGTGKLVHTAVHYHGDSAGGTVESCDFMDIAHNPAGYQGRGINNYGQHIDVLDCTFSDILRIGVFTYNSGATTYISGCTYTGKGDGDWLDYAFEAGNAGNITVEGCTVTDCRGVALVDGSTSAGILVTDYYGPGTEATITGNTLTGNTMGIAVGYDDTDLSVATISGNTLENNKYQVDCTSSVDVDLEATLADNTFDRAVVVRGSDIKVPTIFSSIQDAIDAAVAGDTIMVATGTYVEVGQIVISNNLTIIGGDRETTIIKPAQNTGGSGDARGWFLVQDGKEFNLSNVTLDGQGKNVHQAIRSFGSGTIDNNIIKNICYPTYYGLGMVVMGNYDMTFSNNTFSNIGRIGMMAFGSGVTDAQIIGNTYTGKGEGDWLDYGIEIGGGAKATITGNNISSCGPSATDWESAGILLTELYGPGTEATITGNTVTDSAMGIAIGYDDSDLSVATISGNILENNRYQVDCTSSVDVDLEATLANNTFDRAVVVRGSPIKVPTIFSSIQDAIDAADPGDTVDVADGTYTEQLTISDIGLTITGESESGVIVQAGTTAPGSSNVFTINAAGKNITIQNMTIRNGLYGIRSSAGDVNVLHCTFYHNGYNGFPYDSPPTQVNAAAIWASGNTTNGGAMRIQDSGSSEIAYCTAYDNLRGIRFQDGDNGNIHDCVSYNNIESGIYLASSTKDGNNGCTNTVVRDCESHGNMNNGILVIDGKNITVDDNDVYNNWNTGIMLWYPSEVVIENNTLTDNNLYSFNGIGNPGDDEGGIWMRGVTAMTPLNFVCKILNNTINDTQLGGLSEKVGINVDDVYDSSIVIEHNTFSDHDIDVWVQYQAATTVVNYNNFGTDYGIKNDDTSATLDGKYNWWGDASGPYHATSNPSGTGDAVSDNVDYSPWWGANYIDVAHPWDWYTNDSIQDAVDAASAGDTINVMAGTYTGFEVTKDELTIQGPTDAVVSGAAAGRDAVVYIGSGVSSVTIQGLTIDAAGVKCGIRATESGTYSNIAVLDSTIKDFKKGGIVVRYASAVELVSNNISTTDHSEAPNGIQIGNVGDTTGTTGTIEGNQISGCYWDGYDPLTETYEDDWTGSGILVIDVNSALEISDNEVQGCDVGMDIESGTPTTITGNDVHDNSYGFVLWNAAATINYNSIYQDALYGVYCALDGSFSTVDATYNWWGDYSGPFHETLNPDGEGNAVSDKVDFIPWYGDEGMTTLVSHSTYKFDYEVPDVIVTCEDTEIPVTFQTDVLGDVGYDGVRFKFDATGPPGGDVIFKATDSEEHEYTFVNSGYWGLPAGFNLTADYTATTDWSLNFSEPGEYTITFSLIAAPDGEVIAGIEGSEDVTVRAVDILDHYRYLHEPYDEVTTLDLLAAADDWIANEVPPGFSEPITTMQLLALADEWYAS